MAAEVDDAARARHKGHVPAKRQAFAYWKLLTRGRQPAHRKFVIFAQGRTGSSLLVDVLDSSPEVRCEREILTDRALLPKAFAEGRAAAHRGFVYGFKVKIYQLTLAQGVRDPHRWLSQMSDAGWSLVYLHRNNILRHALSSFSAERHQGFQFVGSNRPPRTSLVVDLPLLEQRLRFRQDMLAAEAAALEGLPHHEVGYEDDLLDPDSRERTLMRLAPALGFAPTTPKVSRHQINVGPLSDLIENYDEVSRYLTGTQWEQFLE